MKEMFVKETIRLLTEKVNASKRWNVPINQIEETIEFIVNNIQYLNSIKADQIFIEGRTIHDIPVCSEFKEFIIPNTVRLVAGDRRYPDMLYRPTVELKEFSYYDWMNNLTKFRGFFKKDLSSDMINIDELRLNLSINDIIDKVPVNNLVKYDGVPFIPIWILPDYELLFKSDVHSTNVNVLLEYYIAEMKW